MVSCTASPTVSPAANGGRLATYPIEIDLLGAKYGVSADIQGRLKTNVELSSADGEISLSLNEGTIVLDKDEEPLQFIHAAIDPTLPPPPEGAYIVGMVYDLTPQGATFNPPLKLTISYDLEELLQETSERDVYIACYEDTKWDVVRYKQVDAENHRVTTQIDRSARFAVLAPRELTSPKPDLTPISLEQALSSGKPTLAEFGRGTCVPCKQMKPILEELAVEYQGKLNVVIVEIDEYRDLTNQHGIMAIPTQIFFDSSGEEVTRHMGFWAKEEIITQLKKMGIE